jgi:hypothetical protein
MRNARGAITATCLLAVLSAYANSGTTILPRSLDKSIDSSPALLMAQATTADEEIVGEETAAPAKSLKPVSDTAKPAAGAAGLTSDKIDRLKASGSGQKEELLLDEEEIAGEPKPAGKPAPRDSSAPAAASAAPIAGDSLAKASPASAPAPQPVAIDTAKKTQPVVEARPVIEKTGRINFAENLKNYRSPKLAMLFSAILPGAGQAYVQEYWQTGVFVAAEAAIIGASVWQASKGKDQFTRAKRYANENFDVERFAAYYNALVRGIALNLGIGEDSAKILVNNSIYYYDPVDTLRRLWENRGKNDDFYTLVGQKNQFEQGWKDCLPFTDTAQFNDYMNYLALPTGDSVAYASGDTSIYYSTGSLGIDTASVPYKFDRSIGLQAQDILRDTKRLGFSYYWDRYNDMLDKRSNYYRNAKNILFALLVNHIISAIDAGIMAKAYNDRLLSKESFWHRVGVEEIWVRSPSGGSIPGVALNISF